MSHSPDESPAFSAPVHDPVLDTKGAAAYCGLSTGTFNRLRCTGEGSAYIQLSANRVGYRLSALNAWIAARERRSTSDRGEAA